MYNYAKTKKRKEKNQEIAKRENMNAWSVCFSFGGVVILMYRNVKKSQH